MPDFVIDLRDPATQKRLQEAAEKSPYYGMPARAHLYPWEVGWKVTIGPMTGTITEVHPITGDITVDLDF